MTGLLGFRFTCSHTSIVIRRIRKEDFLWAYHSHTLLEVLLAEIIGFDGGKNIITQGR